MVTSQNGSNPDNQSKKLVKTQNKFLQLFLPGNIMRKLMSILIVATLLVSCSKISEPYIIGKWQVEKQLMVTYSDHNRNDEISTDLVSTFMDFNVDGSGVLATQSGMMQFNYIVSHDKIVLSNQACKKATWYIIENENGNMVMEHNNPTKVIVRYMRRIDMQSEF
jgi:hypothetical protein